MGLSGICFQHVHQHFNGIPSEERSEYRGASDLSILRRTGHRMTSFSSLVAIFFAFGTASAQTAPQLLPYTVTTIAGGAASSPAKGTVCPSGHTATDDFGDGCLATEVALTIPRFVTQDKQGNIFFSDTGTTGSSSKGNKLIRRIDAATGVITAIAGGAASNPAKGASCGSPSVSTDAIGDGCLSSSIALNQPHGLAFAPNGDLYFAENGTDTIRKIAATGGLIQGPGVVTLVAGNPTAYGYATNVYSGGTLTTPINAATQSYLNFPSGITFDQQGNLYIADEGNNAVEVINLTSATETIMGLQIPVGTIAKLVGYGTGTECTNFVNTGNRGGCKTGLFTSGHPAQTSNIRADYDVAVDTTGNLYFTNEYYNNVGMVSPSGILTNYAGIQNTPGKVLTRGIATSTAIGSDFNLALDSNSNLYISDSSAGVIWRVDAVGNQMYVIAGGATTPCAGTIGDGCPATEALLSGKGIGSFATTNVPGVAGLHVDPAGNLLVTDALPGGIASNRIRKISNGTQFGTVNGSKPTQNLDVHFGIGDGPGANTYTLTSGASNFVLGAAACTLNSDQTQDCILPVQATPTVPGAFTSTLVINSAKGLQSAPIVLSGEYTPVAGPSHTTLAVSSTNGCAGTTIAVGSQVVSTATAAGNGGTPTGTVTFYNGSTQIGTPQTLNSAGQASITTSFTSPGSESITAVYNSDPFFLTSTSPASTLTVAAPSFSTSVNSAQQNTIAAGQSALYSILLTGNVYAGNITFSCSGLPANSSCIFNPTTVTESGCTNTQTVALTIQTAQATPVKQSSFAMAPFGQGPWSALGILPGLATAFAVMLRRRKSSSMKYGQVWLAAALLFAALGVSACGNGTQSTPGTPAGTSTVTVTASDSGGNKIPLSLTLVVH